MIIQHNQNALNSRNKLKANISGLKKSSERLSSGYKINRAGDDAAGLAVSEKMRSQIRGLNQAVRNSQDGINLIQTFEGALDETVAIIHRAKALAEQMANGTYDDSVDRNAVELEYLHLCDEADQIAETDFNGIVMLNGKPESAVIADIENNINSATESLHDTIFEISEHTAAPSIETKAYAASAAAVATPKAGGVACGDFTVYGNSSDFSFDTANGVLRILGGNVTVEGTGAATSNTIVVSWGNHNEATFVTLKNVNIDVSTKFGACAFKIADNSKGDVTVTLEGSNTLKSGAYCAGLQKNGSGSGGPGTQGTLTINGDGSLDAYGGSNGAGIGGGDSGACNIEISGGVVTATGGDSGAGIGGGNSGSEYIKISGGTVIATGGHFGAGIGGGDGGGTNITINEGTVIAVGGDDSAGIGGGHYSAGGDITISGGTVTATGGDDGAGIGGGWIGGGYNITIGGGTVTAIGGGGGAGIGGGHNARGNGVTIKNKDTIVMAKGGTEAEDIGSGKYAKPSTINIDNILTKEPYNDDKIIDGTIVHYTGTDPNPPNPIDPLDPPEPPDNPNPPKPVTPDEPNRPDNPDKFIVSIPNAFGNATAKLTYTDNLTLQVGARAKDSVNFTFKYGVEGLGGLKADLNCTANGLGMDALMLKTQECANYAIDRLDYALNKVSKIRATFGAAQNRLEHKITNLTTSSENVTEAESSIRDTDMASEMMNYTKFNILQQAAQSMLAQANQMPQSVLQLLG